MAVNADSGIILSLLPDAAQLIMEPTVCDRRLNWVCWRFDYFITWNY